MLNVFGVLADDNNATFSCGSNNLSLCLNETSCEGAEGKWEDSVCQVKNETEDEDDNETEVDDDNETEDDENSGCANITDKTLCEAKKNCEYNNATQKCVKTTKIKKLKESLQAYLNSTECPEDCVCAGNTIKCETENGRVMTVVAGKSGNVIIITKTANASTSVVLIKNSTGLYGTFSGKVKKIKYMPDEIKEKVLKKLKITNATSYNITLNDDGSYVMNIDGKYRVLWIFPRKTTVVMKINSETGDVVIIKKPWWKFRAE